jgi:hypothetical protein
VQNTGMQIFIIQAYFTGFDEFQAQYVSLAYIEIDSIFQEFLNRERERQQTQEFIESRRQWH